MAKTRRRGRRVDPTGRSIGESRHVRLYHYELDCPAYRSLSIGARALLVELKRLYNGNNNGELFLSIREAAKRLNAPNGKNLAAKLFDELQTKGWIRPNVAGDFKVKTAAGGGRATSWILTEFPVGNALATKDFMRWGHGPPKINLAVPPQGHSVPPEGTVTPLPPRTVPARGTAEDENVDSRSLPRDTYSLPREVA